MQELLLIRSISKLITDLDTPWDGDGELDLIDSLSSFISRSHLSKASVRDIEKMWQDVYNGYMEQTRVTILPSINEYTPLTPSLKASVIGDLTMAKHALTTVIATRYKFGEILEKIRLGSAKQAAFPQQLLQEITAINLTPDAFYSELAPHILASREAIVSAIELDDAEVDQLVSLCDDENTLMALVVSIPNISETDLRDMLEQDVITYAMVKSAVERFC